MKARINILKAMFTFVVSMACSTVFAQDAFYIYRNDGDFDGFFFDEVKRMGYSKVDLDSIEHNIYVVQEIETEDSLYRIPLAAIDSIGFQQPEIILNPKLIYLDQTGASDYVERVDNNYADGRTEIIFNKDIPEELKPQVDDVIASFDNPIYNRSYYSEFTGFVGKVAHASRYSNNRWWVSVYPITEISDCFVQLISIEEVGADEDGNIKRRMAGVDENGNPKKGAAPVRVNLVDFNATLHKELKPTEKVSIALDAGLGLKVGLRMAYNISTTRIFVKTAIDTDVQVKPAVGIKASGSFEYPVDGIPQFLKSIKFPAVAPLFQTRPFPDVFVRGSGELGAKLSLPSMNFNWRQVFTIDTDNYPLFVSYRMIDNGPSDTDQKDFIDVSDADLSVSLSGFLQTGIKMSANVETNDWFRKILNGYLGVDFYCGPKVEGNLNFSMAGLMQDGAYGAFKDSYVKAHICSVDMEAKAKVDCLWGDPQETTFLDASKQFGTLAFYVFPTFNKTEATYDEKSGDLNVIVHPNNATLFPCHVGMILYDYKGDEVEKIRNPKQHFLSYVNNDFEHLFAGIPCGRYKIRPFVEMLGKEFVVTDDNVAADVLITPILDLRTDSVDVASDGETLNYAFITNSENVQLSAPNWIIAKVEDIDVKEKLGGLVLECKPNTSLFERRGMVILSASAGNYTTRDTLIVKQVSDTKIKCVKINVHYSNRKLTTHSTTNYEFSYQDNQSYDKTESAEGSGDCRTTFGYSGNGEITCSRNGDIITCTGTYIQNVGVKKYTNTLSFNVNISDPSHPYIVGGNVDNKSYYNFDETLTGVEANNRILPRDYYWDYTNHSAMEDQQEHASWNNVIPFTDYVRYYNWDRDDIYETMSFTLQDIPSINYNYSYKAGETYKGYYTNKDGKTNYAYYTNDVTKTMSDFEMGDGSYIQIYIGY